MAVSDIEAVLNFLRKNGLSEAESALKDDILEIENIILFDFEKFQSPINPTLPPVRIESGQSKLGISDNVLACPSSSSDDFISLGSSGFTNPYGFPSTTPTNKSDDSSSDRLSQFGTARNYPDSGMLNDMFLCDEKDDDYFDKDFVSCRSEDKFITTSNAIERYENSSGKSFFLSNNLVDDIDDIFLKDCYHLYKTSQLENGIEAEPKGGSESNLLVPIYDCCIGLEGFNVEEFEDGNRLKIVKEPNLIDNGETKCPSGRDFTSENRVLESGNSSIDKESANFNRENFKKGSGLGIQVSEQPLEPFEDDCFEIDDSLLMAEEAHDGQVAGDGENCSTENDLPIYEAIEDEYEVFDLRIIHRKNRTGFEASKDLPIVLNTILVGRYYVTEYLGSAAFSKVVQAHDIQMGIDVCLKIIKNDKDFFDQSLDEIKLLKFINKHDPSDQHHILRLYDYFYHQEHLFIVCELLRANLYEFQKFNRDSGAEVYFTLPRLQSITRQCLEALEFLHQLGIIHSDLKPENILIKSYSRCKIKVIDLGSSCFRSDNLNLYVQSRSYRAPEVILGLPYDEKIDIWSLGCILAELSSGHVLFPNEALVVILARIIGMLGPIDMEMIVNGQETDKYFTKEYDLYRMNEETNQLEYIIPEESSLEHQLEVTDIRFIEFIKELLETNPRRRPSASEALKHPWLLYQYE